MKCFICTEEMSESRQDTLNCSECSCHAEKYLFYNSYRFYIMFSGWYLEFDYSESRQHMNQIRIYPDGTRASYDRRNNDLAVNMRDSLSSLNDYSFEAISNRIQTVLNFQ